MYYAMDESVGITRTHCVERVSFSSLPKRILTMRQCLLCFDFLAREIADMADVFESYISQRRFEEIMGESKKPKSYKELRDYFNLQAEKIADITRRVRDYITTGSLSIPTRNGYVLDITKCVKFVNKATIHVDTEYQDYSEMSILGNPPVEEWYNLYAASVYNFNICVDEWNARFCTRFAGANLPAHYRIH